MSWTPTANRRTSAPTRAGAWKAAAVLVALVLLVGACGSEEGLSGTVVKDGAGCPENQVDRKLDDVPAIAKTTKVGKDVGTDDLTVGKGCPIDGANYLSLDLVGATAADGKVFRDTFADGGQPLTVRPGQGQLLAGLETGLQDMKVGGRRSITIPADQAYGAEGNEAQGIGKDAALVFVVDLVAATKAPIWCNPLADYVTEADGKPIEGKPAADAFTLPTEATTGDEVVTTDLVEGDGEEVGEDRYVTVNYLGIACSSGQQFDASWDKGETLDVALGTAPQAGSAIPVIPGWSEGLATAKVGSLRQLDIPAALGYGVAGSGGGIGPNEPLTFIIEVISVSDEAPGEAPTTTTTPVPEGEATTTVAPEGEATTTVAPDGEATTTVAPEAETTTSAPPATTTTEGE